MSPMPLCQQHHADPDTAGRAPHNTTYLAVVNVDTLPRTYTSDYYGVQRGAAVQLHGAWWFFSAREPALAFGRAARMSLDCSAYEVYWAARQSRFCDQHRTPETVLLIDIASGHLDHRGDEIEDLQRFVDGVAQHPSSSHWHEPRTPPPARTQTLTR